MDSKDKKKQGLLGKLFDAGRRCRNVSELDGVFDKTLPGETAKQAKSLIKDRSAVEALLVAFTGDKDIGKRLDAIYGEPKKGAGGKR